MQYIYTKPNISEISLKELTRAHIEKTNARKMIYDTIYKQCCEKIRYMNSQWHKTACYFIVPSIQIGMPIYKMETCIVYLMYKLKQKGFSIQFVYPNRLVISWKHALLKDLKENDKEWHKITDGKIYDDTSNDNATISAPSYYQQPSLSLPSSYQPLQSQQLPSSLQPQLQLQSPLQSQLQPIQSEQARFDQMKLMQRSPSLALPPPPPSIIIEPESTDDDRREAERIRKKRERKADDIMYRNEQARIADVISRKNQEAIRSLNYSKPSHDKHKKVLQIKPDK